MHIIFKDETLDRLDVDASFDAGLPQNLVKAFRKRTQQIRAFKDERDFYNLKSLRFEKLRGNRKHQHSIRLNDQWRLILEFEEDEKGKKVMVICIEDYH
jgi:toxin HigB-1